MLNRVNALLTVRGFPRDYGVAGEAAARRVYLATVPQTAAPLAVDGRTLERLRIIVMVPGGAPPQSRSGRVIGPLPFLPSRPAVFDQHADFGEIAPRPVRGELLRDERGQIYERIGRHIRPVPELAASPDGTALVIDGGIASRAASDPDSRTGAAGTAPMVRALFAPPGLRRVVRFGDFREMLAPALLRPVCLRDSHRLPCYLQIFEANADMAIDQFRQNLSAAEIRNPQLVQPWSASRAAEFQLSLPEAHEPQASETPGIVRAGSRYFHLHVASDPTAHVRPISAASVAAPAQYAPPVAQQPQSPRPEQVSIGREQAVKDMQLAALREGPLRRLLMLLLPPARRRDLRTWQLVLAGKTLSQQLWQVSPPRNGLRDPRVRQWASETLRLSGKAPQATLDDWEIHWRRRGLR